MSLSDPCGTVPLIRDSSAGSLAMTTEQPKCFGTMFPDLDRLQPNQPLAGKSFSVLKASCGMIAFDRGITVNLDAWRSCQSCCCFRECYDLGMAKLALWTALQHA